MRLLIAVLLVVGALAAVGAEGRSEYEWGKVPPKHLGKGDACLFVRLVERDGRKPVSAWIRLWRLDVPEDDEWSAGDQIQAELAVPKEGVRIEDLPIGRYRIQCDDQRKGASDPPPFTVATEFRRDFEVDMPRRFRARLAVFDVNGLPVERGTVRAGIPAIRTRAPVRPAWVNPREPKRGSTFLRIGGGIG